jgi:hypothetical protein
MDIWLTSGCEHVLHFKMRRSESTSHNSLYETECLMDHENKNTIAVFDIIFCVGKKTAQSVLTRSVLKKITSSHNG